jgi:hypothetical protein
MAPLQDWFNIDLPIIQAQSEGARHTALTNLFSGGPIGALWFGAMERYSPCSKPGNILTPPEDFTRHDCAESYAERLPRCSARHLIA